MPMSLPLPGANLDSRLESKDASVLIGWYTLVLHFLALFFFLDVYRGNASDSPTAPIFEYSAETMYTMSITLAIYSGFYTVVASLGLIRGIKTETRIYYFPWFILTALEIVYFSFHVATAALRYRYDMSESITLPLMVFFVGYHVYLYLIVLSNYRYLKRIQSPTIIFPDKA